MEEHVKQQLEERAREIERLEKDCMRKQLNVQGGRKNVKS